MPAPHRILIEIVIRQPDPLQELTGRLKQSLQKAEKEALWVRHIPKRKSLPKPKASRRGKTSKAKTSTKAEKAFLKKREYQRKYMAKYRARQKKEARK